jgi:lipopolysaccharide export system permease protein
LSRLNTYILRELFKSFGFFALIFTGVIWLTQSVTLIDTVVGSGQSARVFLEFSMLVLPQVLVIVLPLSGIGAALHALNRLYSDTELVVMMASGYGPGRLMAPVGMFGALVGVAMAGVLILLIPVTGKLLTERTQEVRSDLAQSLIVERQFIHPFPGLTLFINDTDRAGEMSGIFLNDQRDLDNQVTYSAERALFLRDGDQARLVMQEGVALSTTPENELNSVSFDQFTFDLSELLAGDDKRTPRPSEYSVLKLLRPTDGMLDTRYGLGDYISEGHYKLSLPLLALTYPLIALVTFLAGGYRRSGFGRRVVVAVAVAILIQLMSVAAQAQTKEHPELWPLMYVPLLVSAVYIGALLNILSVSYRNHSRRPV